MEHELLKSGSVLGWFGRQFLRLRYAGSQMLVRHRLIQQLDHVRQCMNVNLLPAPVRPADGQPPTHAQVRDEKLYNYKVDICKRLL
eukprot:9246834-Heterocapsa_arctica.AAC.1